MQIMTKQARELEEQQRRELTGWDVIMNTKDPGNNLHKLDYMFEIPTKEEAILLAIELSKESTNGIYATIRPTTGFPDVFKNYFTEKSERKCDGWVGLHPIKDVLDSDNSKKLER